VNENYFELEIIRLAKFLRETFPKEVDENIQKPFEESSAVDLAIELLKKYHETLS